jgi:hypothetical protein
MRPRKDPVGAFWAKVDLGGPPPSDPWVPITTGCWLWTDSVTRFGYGQFYIGKTDEGQNVIVKPHRFAYELLVRSLEQWETIDHLCRVGHCVNPDHMEPVTAAENRRRGRYPQREQTHCKYGHPFDDGNTYLTPRGKRECRACWKRKIALRATRKQGAT